MNLYMRPLNHNNIVIRNSNSMDTIRLVEMLSKLGIIKKKKRRTRASATAESATTANMPMYGASKFLDSRPVVSLSNNVDAGKAGEIDALKREAFYHIGRLQDQVQRSQHSPEDGRIKVDRHINRNDDDDESVFTSANDFEVPSNSHAEMKLVGPNDETAEMQDDRIIDYAGEGNEGIITDDGDSFIEPGSPIEPPPESEEAPRAEYTPEPSAVYAPEETVPTNKLNRMLRGIIVNDFPKLNSGMTVQEMQVLTTRFLLAVNKQFPEQANAFEREVSNIMDGRKGGKRADKYEQLRSAIERFGKANNLI